ncbi:NfuA family Fe-S biogenesis protein [Buchnera aphidicola]|uniref:Fe/S biogenesis protein NfuA n=1 Tax=Buchnera aphidicola str. USDA (Myzus persicae) TaxID=1009856 RepID=W0NZG5_BUCMP|nr:NfuA family Fe-S biogenesis protein [Buchnera aphidicola]AHG59859.1 Yhgi [Buchnera aphidicola str. USDA (Myzus persicae)]AHG60439.1 Yhgi [Buchnera aphidicola str. W106 (Myzus persicae)]AHG61012.1 Yhgi [Buchnera aphidicola str. G002 (Myzus persicae)]AHG61584.1 Yhgi [Buchnera aphidicola str. F009 (Myzus persicae)]WAI02902.1 MAG: NfuA family Fe-S biogenesis protein [Buchnera aphidicola (Myzus persicae)]
MITVSKKAQKHFQSLLSKEPNGTQIRVFIINPGTVDAECGVAYCPEEEVEEVDIALKYDKFFIYVNKNIIPYLKNSEIDLVIDNLGSQLTLKAPYAKNNFSKNNFSKKSFSLEEKVNYFLNTEINPQLSMHGGKINLIGISDKGVATIQFSGGCNGCSMIGLTLKETVETKLLASFPEIKKIYDETDHLHGKHSFY